MTVKVSFDLKKEFDDIINEYGHYVLVLRKDRRTYCSCYNEVTREANRTCPYCLGLGYNYVAEKHRVRSEDESDPTSLNRLMMNKGVGHVVADDRRYFVRTNCHVESKDLFLEVDWDSYGRPSYNGRGIFQVSTVDRQLDLGQDKEIYRIAYANETPIRSKIRGIYAIENLGKQQYKIIMEE